MHLFRSFCFDLLVIFPSKMVNLEELEEVLVETIGKPHEPEVSSRGEPKVVESLNLEGPIEAEKQQDPNGIPLHSKAENSEETKEVNLQKETVNNETLPPEEENSKDPPKEEPFVKKEEYGFDEIPMEVSLKVIAV